MGSATTTVADLQEQETAIWVLSEKWGNLPALELARRQYRATRARKGIFCTEGIYLPIEGDEVEGLMM